jgi:hypothetical protein
MLVFPALLSAENIEKTKVYPTAVTPIDLASELRRLEIDKDKEAFSSSNNLMTAMSGGSIKNMTVLPDSKGLRVVQLDNNDMFLMTGNGRFFIKMEMMLDVWKSNRIREPSDLLDVEKVTLEEMRMNVGTLGRYPYGSGKKMITIIHDPADKYTEKLFNALDEIESDYLFRMIPVPSSNKLSMEHVAKFWCSIPFSGMFEFIKSGGNFDDLPMPSNECSVEPIQRNIALASIMQIKKLPYTIRQDGVHLTGLPKTSREFLDWIKEGDE